ncbi:MAG: ATP-binding protein [Cytophagales bacterium]|nr:ATP-binding protein [Cytophagales bacterium]
MKTAEEIPITEAPTLPAVRVLIVDPSEDDFNLIKGFIQAIPYQQFIIDWCGDYVDGLYAFHESNHDIYFIDYYLGNKTGIDLLKQAITMKCKDPMILMTGHGDHNIDMEAMRSGAADYLLKSELTSEKLDRCIRYSVMQASTLKQSHANERKFQAIFERSRDFLFVATHQLELTDVNDAASELLGYTKDELCQLSIYDLMLHDHEKEELAERLKKGKEIIDLQIVFLTHTKFKKNFILSTSFELDSFGNPYIQGIIRDTTLLKKVLDIKLQSEKLEAKGMVIRTLAHEIRNPLHNITISLGCLKSEVNEDNNEFLRVIERNSKRINDLINQLMDSNQYHKMKLEVTPLQLVLQDTLEKAADQITLNKTKLILNFPKEDADALVDKEQLEIAFLNVITNAVEAMPQDRGELTISISPQYDFHNVIIHDNGSGMSEENAKKVFEPYFTSKPKGLGLGLAATHAIVQSHKADITVHSVLNQGTTFTFTFPAL